MKHPALGFLTAIALTLSIGAGPILINAVVDPFDHNRLINLGLAKTKLAEKRHGPLAKVIRFPQRNSPYVVFGDSRSRALREKLFRESRFGTDVFNFAYGGGTLPEMVDSFWYAAERSDLKGVVLGVPLRMFTTDYKKGKNQVPEALRIAADPTAYYTSPDIASLSLDILESRYDYEVGTLREAWTVLVQVLSSPMPKARSAEQEAPVPPAFVTGRAPPPLPVNADIPRKWRHQLTKAAANDWSDFSYAESYFEAIAEIVAYCNQKGIKVVFFIPPTPIEMQNTLDHYGQSALALTHRLRLSTMAPVLDFDFSNPVTADRQNFSDAYHFKAPLAREIAHEVVRQFGTSERSEAWIAKRRNRVRCPIHSDTDAVDLPGTVNAQLGENCIVWGG